MKKTILTFAALLLIAAPAMADMMVTVTRTVGTWSGSGGEFTVTPSGDIPIPGVPDGVPFQTFCVETNEYINIGGSYHVDVNTAAVLGDGGKISNGNPLTGGWGDPLDAKTAYLYTQFRAGTLAGYDYTPGPGGTRPASAAALQNAIWVIEEESQVVLQDGLATTFKDAADEAVDSGAWSGIGNVRILNLYTTTTRTEKQDQLVLIPAPAALLLGVVGLALVGWARKRIR